MENYTIYDKEFNDADLTVLLRKVADKIDEEYRGYTKNNVLASEFINENIDEILDGSLFVEVKEEENAPFTSYSLQKQLSWEKFTELTGVSYYAKNDGFTLKDDEIFRINKSDIKKYNLK